MATMPEPLETRLPPGTRVRIRARTPLLRLRADTGMIVRKDEWADYYIVRLDEPALFHAGAEAPTEVVTEIREDADNLEVESRSFLRPVMLLVGAAFFLAVRRGFRRRLHLG